MVVSNVQQNPNLFILLGPLKSNFLNLKLMSSVSPVSPIPETLRTEAAVTVQMVDTLSSVLTAMVHTFIIINAALWPDPPWNTHTPDTHTHTHTG